MPCCRARGNFRLRFPLATRSPFPETLAEKAFMRMSNALDFSRGMPPTLSICNTESLGERIQATFPDVRVVKTLNTINANVMVNPSLVPGDHDVFLSGNDGDVPPAVVSAQGGVQDA